MNYPLSFLLGAGASAPYNVPMMTGFYSQFRSFIETRHPDCFALLQGLETKENRKTNDLETLLTDLQIMLGGTKAMELLGVAQTAEVEKRLETAHQLRGYLDAFIVDTCERFDREKAQRELRPLLELATIAPMHVFTTNYDRIPEYVCEQLKIAYSDGFMAEGTQPVADWTGNFEEAIKVIKLHGSVNWYVDATGKVFHRLDRGYSLPSYDFHLTRNDQVLKPLMIIPTLEKEIFADPYSKLSSLFNDVLMETKVLMIAGNSLRDLHIKSQIANRIKTMRVIIVSPNASKNLNIINCPERTHALDIGFSELLSLGATPLKEFMEKVKEANDDETIKIAIDVFIKKVSDKYGTETAIQSDQELSKIYQNVKAENASVRISAIQTLSDHPHPAITALLIETLTSDKDSYVRAATIAALFKLRTQEAIEAIKKAALEDDSPDVQAEAILSVSHLEDTKTANAILEEVKQRESLSDSSRLILEDVFSQE